MCTASFTTADAVHEEALQPEGLLIDHSLIAAPETMVQRVPPNISISPVNRK
jgi:hypothetical protein